MKKEQLIQEYLNKPYEVGENVYIQGLGCQDKNAWGATAEIKQIDEEGVFIIEHRILMHYPFSKVKKCISHLGYSPMEKMPERPRSVAFSLDSILFTLGLDPDARKHEYTIQNVKIEECSMNPFIFDSEGKKVYYQRPLVWELEDKQLLIESIYNGVSIGTVIVRKRGWRELEKLVAAGHTDVAFKDIVDGKQRISTISEFINNGFPDMNGFYWDDFSDIGKHRFFRDCGIFYAEYGENTPDKVIHHGFLAVNFAGKPQSKEHIEFLKSIKV